MSDSQMPAPPPLPPDMPAEIRFQYDLARWSTSTLYAKLEELRVDVKAIDTDLDEGKGGLLSPVVAWFGKLPQAVQIAAAVGGAQLVLEWSGALFERFTGHPPPQTTIPVVERSNAGTLGAATAPASAAVGEE